MTLLEKVKANLILEHSADDELLQMYITAAVMYAESYQHLPENTYTGRFLQTFFQSSTLSLHYMPSRIVNF